MRKIEIQPSDEFAGEALAKKLYSSPIAALGEIVFNGFDAARLKSVEPYMEINFWKPGEHPLTSIGLGLSILDNGTGMTDKAILAYNIAGQSVHRDRDDIHGQHGVGKFAPLALGQSFYITTNTGDGTGTWRFKIEGNVFKKSFEAEPVRKSPLKLYPQGTFTEIFIPNIEAALAPELVRRELTNLLTLLDWTVLVQGEEVVKRVFRFQVRTVTPPIPALKGPVIFELGVANIGAERDEVFLVDSISGRFIGEFHGAMPASVRKLVHPILIDPRLCGAIQVPYLEKWSAASRSGLKSDFWSSSVGIALIEVFNTFGLEAAKKVLGEEEEPGGALPQTLPRLVSVFERGFGKPDLKQWKPSSTGTGSSSKPEGCTKPSGSGGSTSPGIGVGHPKTPKEGVYVRIEDATYSIISFPTQSTTPAEVRKGNVLVINTNHPEIVRLQKERASRALLDGLVQGLIIAHVAATRPPGVDLFGIVYDLKLKALAGSTSKK